MSDTNPTLLVTELNANTLTTPNKRQGLAEWVLKS